MSKHQDYAKVTRPKFSSIINRKRLFTILDRLRRRHPIIWVNGPPGSGKTVLVSSYLESRKIHHIWYQIDPRDSDVATLFYYMGLVNRRIASRKKPLPSFTLEYSQHLPAFTSLFFEGLFSRLKPASCIVFDNYNELQSNSLIHDVICNGLTVMPNGITVIIISRGEPPHEFARFVANDQIATLCYEDLRLRYQELVTISRLKHKRVYPAKLLMDIYENTDGWAAGVVLLLNAVRRGAAIDKLNPVTPDTITGYFHSQIIRRLDSGIYNFLLKTSLLPCMDHDMAMALTGLRDAGHVLSYLNQNNCFTEKRYIPHLVYQYNPMFRKFLLSALHAAFSSDEIKTLMKKASSILENSGRHEDAFGLLGQCSDWEGCIRLITGQANNLITDGRRTVLVEWINFIPDDIYNNSPWLLYWLGICRMPVSQVGSRKLFKNAFRLFLEQHDARGAYLSWSGFVDACCIGLDDLKPLDDWIDMPEKLINSFDGFPDVKIEAMVTSRMFMALVYRRPQHPDIERWGDRAINLLDICKDSMLKAVVLSNHAFNSIRAGEFEKAAYYIESYREMVDSGKVNTLIILMMKWTEVVYLTVTGSHDKCLKVVSEGLRISESTGVCIMDFMLMGHGTLSSLNADDCKSAHNLIKKMGYYSGRLRPSDQGFFNMLVSYDALIHGNFKKAAIHAEEALKQAEDVGFPVAIALCSLENAHVMHGLNDHKTARYYLRKGLKTGKGIHYPYIEFIGRLTMAWFAFSEGKEDSGLEALRRGFETGSNYRFSTTYFIRPQVLSHLCCKALQSGIEKEYVRHLIRARNLTPVQTSIEISEWPWRVKIFTLGRFGLVRDDIPVQFSRKSRQRPLEMLKVLIAFRGRGVRKELLADILWPDLDGDTVHQNFEVTLHRLRKLLGVDGAVQLKGSLLSIAPSCCWVDVWAFERLIGEAEAAISTSGFTEKTIGMVWKAINMYNGQFLSEDAEKPWSSPLREKLRSKFLRHLAGLGSYREKSGEPEKAIECLQRGIEVDPLAEEFYQQLMTCYMNLGRSAEATATYHRCKMALSSGVGLQPSQKTEAIYKKIIQK